MAEQLEAYTTGDNTEYTVRIDNERLGQTFKHNVGFGITSIKLKLWKEGTPGTNLKVSIYATTGTPPKPTGDALATVDYATANITETSSPGAWYTVTITLAGLSADTDYAIVLGPDETDWGAGNWVKWRQDAAPAGYGNGNGVDENVGVWSAYTFDYMFEVWGNPSLPGKPTIVSPAPTGVTDITLDETPLSWNASDPAADTYEIYFRIKDATWVKVGEAQAGVTWTIPFETLNYNVTYEWRIDATNEAGTTTGDTWAFTCLVFDPPLPTGLNNMITVRRLVLAVDNKIYYESS